MFVLQLPVCYLCLFVAAACLLQLPLCFCVAKTFLLQLSVRVLQVPVCLRCSSLCVCSSYLCVVVLQQPVCCVLQLPVCCLLQLPSVCCCYPCLSAAATCVYLLQLHLCLCFAANCVILYCPYLCVCGGNLGLLLRHGRNLGEEKLLQRLCHYNNILPSLKLIDDIIYLES